MTREDMGESVTVKRTAAVIGCGLFALLAAGCTKSDEAQGKYSSDPDKAKIEHIVHDYVISHPEIIDEARHQQNLREMAKLIEPHRKEIETPYASEWAGARDGDVTLVEFFDYACPYCRATNAEIVQLLAQDPNLKVVWREFPVLGENSVAAANASLAAAKQGKFKEFHDRMFAAGPPTPETIAKVQKALGLAPVQSAEFAAEIDKNAELGRSLGTSGTPTFVVGDQIISGALGFEGLKEAIAEARKKG